MMDYAGDHPQHTAFDRLLNGCRAARSRAVGTFVQRLQKLAGEASLATQAADARALLVARGLTDDVLKQAIDLLDAG